MTVGTSAPFTLPETLYGCAVNLRALGRHVLAYTSLEVLRRDTLRLYVPVSCVGDDPQEAVNRLGRLVEETWRTVLDDRFPLH